MDNDEYLAALRFCAGREDPTVKFLEEEAGKSMLVEFKTDHIPQDVVDMQEEFYRRLLGL